jgi:SWI/SNF-related matrix-associated actin-dependent regulator 1 of chromatin subfamily A
MIQISSSGSLFHITFSHPDRDQFNILVDCMKEMGAEWDKNSRSWVIVGQKKADILAHCRAFSGTPAELLAYIRKEKAKMLGLPPLDSDKSPDGLTLMDHQSEGVEFIADREGSLIAWEVGVGKTACAIGSINAASDKGFPALIICPAHLKHNWFRELKGDPALKKKGWLVDKSRTVGIAKGNYFPPTDVVIINYDILDRHKEKLDSTNWSFAIIDESHYLRNPKAKRTRAVIGGRKGRGKNGHQWRPLHAKRRVALSATPLVNKPEDLWAICNWLDPKRWPSQHWFVQQFCQTNQREQWAKARDPKTGKMKPVKRMIREVLPPSREQMEKLNKRLTGTVMSRLRSTDVLDLPPLVRRVIEIDVKGADGALKAEQKAIKASEPRATQLRAAVEIAKATGDDLAHAVAIKELADFQKDEAEHVAVLRKKVSLAKVPYVVDHVRDALLDPERKVLVFAHHHQVIEALYEAFEKEYPGGVVHFYGKTSHDQKKDAEDRIQRDPDCRVFIGGITAAGTGLTLTGASHVVFAEEDWLPSNMRQCEGRAWRKGQGKSVLVEHVVAYGSVDSLIAKRMISKQEISDQAIDSGLDLDEPVDWIEDHQIPTPDELKPRKRTTKPKELTLHELVENPKKYKVSNLHLVLASRLLGDNLNERAQAYRDWILSIYSNNGS